VCLHCADWVKRRARTQYHEQHASLSGRLLKGLNSLRGAVLARGWHERGWLGTLLRRLDRYLP
jgi:hypothetical protein